MKIKKVNYMKGEARFIIDEIKDTTFVVELDYKIKKKDVTDDLESQVSEYIFDDTKEKYDDWNIKELEGTDI